MKIYGYGAEKKEKGKPRTLIFQSSDRRRPSWLNSFAGSWLSLMATSVPVLMMPIVVGVLMRMHRVFVAVLMTVMAMSYCVMPMLMFMFVFAMTAHPSSLLSFPD
jgi:hypothetical protein